jgi:hypothetical protein
MGDAKARPFLYLRIKEEFTPMVVANSETLKTG